MENIKAFLQKNIPELIIDTIITQEGNEHSVAEVNDCWIFRFAKNATVQEHMAIEVQLLKSLENKITACSIPKVAYYFPDVHCFGYQKIAGIPLTKELYAPLTAIQKQKLAQDLAEFLYELHSSISVSAGQGMGLAGADWPLTPEQLLNNLKITHDQHLQEIFYQFIKRYQHLTNNQRQHLMVVHNDLHTDNILINAATKELAGIIDFTSAAIGTIYHEFRYLHLIDKELLIAVLQAYSQKSGQQLDIQDAYTYCLATEFSRLWEAMQKKDLQKTNNIKQRVNKLANYC